MYSVLMQVAPSPELLDACGVSPSWACRRIFEATGNKSLAGLVDWLIGGPLHVLLIIVIAMIASVAFGFGAQSLVKDFLTGMFMLMEDQYGVGDIIDAGEAKGTVEAVGLRTTRLRDVEGTVWYIPNGQINRVGNKSQEWARALLDVSVSYDTDLRRAEEVIKDVADSMWHDSDWSSRLLEEPA